MNTFTIRYQVTPCTRVWIMLIHSIGRSGRRLSVRRTSLAMSSKENTMLIYSLRCGESGRSLIVLICTVEDPGRVLLVRMEKDVKIQRTYRKRSLGTYTELHHLDIYIATILSIQSILFQLLKQFLSERPRSQIPVYHFTQWPLRVCLGSRNEPQ